MIVKFHKIRWRNLLSTGNAWISVVFDANPMTLIVGRNGHGKSTMLEALCFVLFNKPFRDINKPQLVNTVNKKDMLVELALSVGSDQYVIRRGIKPAVFEIYRNKELIDQNSDNGDYEDVLQSIIGQSYKTFCQVNILGSAAYTPFMQLKTPERRKVVEDLLDSQIYSVMLKIAKEDQKSLNLSSRELINEIDVIEHKIETLNRLIARQESDLETRQAETWKQVDVLQAQLEELDRNVFRQKVLFEAAQQALDALPFDIEKLSDAISDTNAQIAEIKARISTADKQLTGVEGDNCPVCQQKIDENHKHSVEDEITKSKNDLVTQLLKLQKRQQKLKEMSEERSKVGDNIWQHKNALEKIVYRRDLLKSNHDNLFKQYSQLMNTVIEPVDAAELETLQTTLKTTKDKYDDQCKQLDLIKKCIAYLGDDGIKAKLVNKYIPIINQTLNQYLERMDLFVEFTLDEQFNETIKSRFRDTFSYNSFSEGEKFRIDLAILFTWRKISSLRNSVSSNLLIMDEVLDGSMDSLGKQEFMQILHSLSDAQSTFIISHDQALADQFDNVITAVKNGNFTNYVHSST